MSREDDVAEIRGLMDRYGSTVDERDWAAFAELFDDNVSKQYTGIEPARETKTVSRADHVAGVAGVLGVFDATQHMITNVQVTLDGDRATCRAAMRAEHWLSGLLGAPRYTMFGVYRNGFRRTPDGWKIDHLDIEIVREDGNHGVWDEAIRRARPGAAT